MGGPPMGGGAQGGSPEVYRVDQLRRTFQPRRFGSGYDPVQFDRLFERILQAMTGRGPMPVPENELDTLQFGLVPGGYFEAEVDAALREVKDILLHRRCARKRPAPTSGAGLSVYAELIGRWA